MSEVKPYPYGTVVIDYDGETIMFLGLLGGGYLDDQIGLRIKDGWDSDENLPAIRRIWNDLINSEEFSHTRYVVQE